MPPAYDIISYWISIYPVLHNCTCKTLFPR
jgi:hypothetical protein